MESQQPLNNPDNWTKKKTWVVPLEVTVLVDDPSKYDDEMKKSMDRILNELRSVCLNYAKRGLTINFLDPIKSPKQIEILKKGTNVESIQQDALEEMVTRIMNKKKEEK